MTIPMSRRSLLKAALTLPAVGLVGCNTREQTAAPAPPAPLFFSAPERSFVEAITERLIPDGEDNSGARGAHVAEFIDRQLSSPYGRAWRWYMQGPWEDGIPEQGYQSKLTPSQLYRTAIKDIDAWCMQHHRQPFVGLGGDAQDQVIHGLESGSIALAHVPAETFFTMLWNNTQEGFLADPIYGGNYNFTGWKLVGFPGPRYNYVNEIEQYGKRYTLPTVGILGRNPNQRGLES